MSTRTREIVVDGYTKFCLTTIVLLLVGLIAVVGYQQVTLVPTAQAASGDAQLFGDSSAWRDSMLKASEGTNTRLDDLLKALKSGEMKVQVAEKGAPDASSKGK